MVEYATVDKEGARIGGTVEYATVDKKGTRELAISPYATLTGDGKVSLQSSNSRMENTVFRRLTNLNSLKPLKIWTPLKTAPFEASTQRNTNLICL